MSVSLRLRNLTVYWNLAEGPTSVWCPLWKAVINIVQFTAWCLIPVVKKSRPVDDVLFEIAQLADQGVL